MKNDCHETTNKAKENEIRKRKIGKRKKNQMRKKTRKEYTKGNGAIQNDRQGIVDKTKEN